MIPLNKDELLKSLGSTALTTPSINPATNTLSSILSFLQLPIVQDTLTRILNKVMPSEQNTNTPNPNNPVTDINSEKIYNMLSTTLDMVSLTNPKMTISELSIYIKSNKAEIIKTIEQYKGEKKL